MPMPQQVRRRAYAKVNLALAVGAPLPAGHAKAGFHPIASWMHCIDLFDELQLSALAPGQTSRYEIRWAEDAPRPSAIDWALEKDLAVRAHRALEQETGRTLPVAMDVVKRIPVGGGLGGGSSDGAAALLALDELFGLGLAEERLGKVGTALGSDVAFFLDRERPPRPALVQGLGDSITRLARCSRGLVLVVPPFGCPTPAVYKELDRGARRQDRLQRVRELIDRWSAQEGLPTDELFNDLERPAGEVEPGLVALSRLLREQLSFPILLSGSGSSLFALCEPGESEAVASRIRAVLAGGQFEGAGTAVVTSRLV